MIDRVLLLAILCCAALSVRAQAPQPLVIGETFLIQSKILHEERRINVYAPPAYAASPDVRLPVLYMPDGGIAEDFLPSNYRYGCAAAGSGMRVAEQAPASNADGPSAPRGDTGGG